MYLHSKLQNRSKPIKIGFIGCGKFVSMFLAQYNHLEKIQIDTIIDVNIDQAKKNCLNSGLSKKTISDINFTNSLDNIFNRDIEIFIEATGNPIIGTVHAKKILDRFYSIFSEIIIPTNFTEDESIKKSFISALEDDFNSPKAIHIVQAFAKDSEKEEKIDLNKLGTLKSLLNSLGLLKDKSDNYFRYGESTLSDGEIENLISERNKAREDGNFELADQIREQLISNDIVLEDLENKTVWKKKS